MPHLRGQLPFGPGELLPGRNVGSVLPYLLIFQEKLENLDFCFTFLNFQMLAQFFFKSCAVLKSYVGQTKHTFRLALVNGMPI